MKRSILISVLLISCASKQQSADVQSPVSPILNPQEAPTVKSLDEQIRLVTNRISQLERQMYQKTDFLNPKEQSEVDGIKKQIQDLETEKASLELKQMAME